ncbi:CPBP family intramembrane glutamic endopeptidase [Actinoplanes sp. NBRC 103695]|uniref:CPBP family intramembrane glutamic endopeptidase n=1 Tax=Actinoplanes sp. NBRC 103695 TaxID=3032202 RepID=UPI0024A0A9BC|nr:CPBP family intramembrane glutamic endopeptidase [Actinoplanes sp. NBRC 103695]GLY98331.1 CAAX amino protease [Actinoplanes sp. NBRC 103695]
MRFPLVWLLVGMAGVGAASTLSLGGPALGLVGAVAGVVVYRLVMRYVARRDTPEIAGRGAVPQLLFGVVVGVVFIGVSVLMVITEFSFSRSPGHPLPIVATMAAVSLGAAVTEELLFRGLALQALERMFGSWVALAITALLFGLLHLANPAGTVWSSVAIAVEAGVLLGAAFLWRRNVWFVVGLHFAWNTAVGLLGIPVSGHAADGLLITRPVGPELLTGGAFGLEASIIPVIVSLLLAIPMLILAGRRGNLVPLRRARH